MPLLLTQTRVHTSWLACEAAPFVGAPISRLLFVLLILVVSAVLVAWLSAVQARPALLLPASTVW